jgi:hypothetical protein
LDADIEQRLERAKQRKDNAEIFPLAEKLRSQGLMLWACLSTWIDRPKWNDWGKSNLELQVN